MAALRSRVPRSRRDRAAVKLGQLARVLAVAESDCVATHQQDTGDTTFREHELHVHLAVAERGLRHVVRRRVAGRVRERVDPLRHLQLRRVVRVELRVHELPALELPAVGRVAVGQPQPALLVALAGGRWRHDLGHLVPCALAERQLVHGVRHLVVQERRAVRGRELDELQTRHLAGGEVRREYDEARAVRLEVRLHRDVLRVALGRAVLPPVVVVVLRQPHVPRIPARGDGLCEAHAEAWREADTLARVGRVLTDDLDAGDLHRRLAGPAQARDAVRRGEPAPAAVGHAGEERPVVTEGDAHARADAVAERDHPALHDAAHRARSRRAGSSRWSARPGRTLAVGDYFGAEDFVPVSQAHLMADGEAVGEAGTRMLERLAAGPEAERRVRVPTVTDPRGWTGGFGRRLGQPAHADAREQRIVKALEAFGCLMTNTCINYQTFMAPVRGEHLAFGDTGSVNYATRSAARAATSKAGGRPLGRADWTHAALRHASGRTALRQPALQARLPAPGSQRMGRAGRRDRPHDAGLLGRARDLRPGGRRRGYRPRFRTN